MPVELRTDLFEIAAHQWPAHALLDRLAAADAGRDLAIGVKAEQFSAAEYRLRLFDRARDQILHQHFIGVGSICGEIAQGFDKVALGADKPDAAAGGADRRLQHRRKPDRCAQLASDFTIFVGGCAKPSRSSSRLNEALLCAAR